MADESGHFSQHSYASRRSRRRGAPKFHPENSAVLVEGSDLALITDAGWDFIFAHTEMVFARTTPDQKLQV
jgi:magnesium-transporting ATPase (P-type)